MSNLSNKKGARKRGVAVPVTREEQLKKLKKINPKLNDLIVVFDLVTPL